MKNKLLILSIAIFPLVGFSQKTVTTYYDLKHTKKHEVYVTDSYGTKNGAYTEYSENGGIITTGALKNGNNIGKWIYKDDKGNVVMEENYDNDGKYNGLYTKYENGHKTYEVSYQHGNKVYDKEWYEDGQEYGENAHKQLHYVYYYNKMNQSSYDSTVEYNWNKQGNITELKKYYKNGVQTSQTVNTYNKDGVLLPKAGKYINGVLEKEGVVKNGEEKEYDENGILLSQINYKNGVAEGEAIYYAIDGSGDIMMKGKYSNGRQCGTWKITYNSQNRNASRTSDAAYYRIVNIPLGGDSLIRATDYYMSGTKQSEETFDSKGNFVGSYKEYYANGVMSLSGKYNTLGQKDSIWDNYSVAGNDSIKSKYVNGAFSSTLPTSNR